MIACKHIQFAYLHQSCPTIISSPISVEIILTGMKRLHQEQRQHIQRMVLTYTQLKKNIISYKHHYQRLTKNRSISCAVQQLEPCFVNSKVEPNTLTHIISSNNSINLRVKFSDCMWILFRIGINEDCQS